MNIYSGHELEGKNRRDVVELRFACSHNNDVFKTRMFFLCIYCLPAFSSFRTTIYFFFSLLIAQTIKKRASRYSASFVLQIYFMIVIVSVSFGIVCNELIDMFQREREWMRCNETETERGTSSRE